MILKKSRKKSHLKNNVNWPIGRMGPWWALLNGSHEWIRRSEWNSIRRSEIRRNCWLLRGHFMKKRWWWLRINNYTHSILSPLDKSLQNGWMAFLRSSERKSRLTIQTWKHDIQYFKVNLKIILSNHLQSFTIPFVIYKCIIPSLEAVCIALIAADVVLLKEEQPPISL